MLNSTQSYFVEIKLLANISLIVTTNYQHNPTLSEAKLTML